MVASFVCFCFCFLVLGRSADIFFFATVHIAAALKTLKKMLKKEKKGKHFKKR